MGSFSSLPPKKLVTIRSSTPSSPPRVRLLQRPFFIFIEFYRFRFGFPIHYTWQYGEILSPQIYLTCANCVCWAKKLLKYLFSAVASKRRAGMAGGLFGWVVCWNQFMIWWNGCWLWCALLVQCIKYLIWQLKLMFNKLFSVKYIIENKSVPVN